MKQSKTKMILFCATIFLTAFVSQCDAAILPIAGVLYEVFPNSTFAVNFIISGPMLLMLISSLAVPYMYKFMSRKKALLVTCIVFFASCACATIAMSLPLLVFYRTISGICIGLQQVIAVDSVTGYFMDDEKLRATVVGLYNAAQAGIGAVLGIVAGNLAVHGWQNVYHAFWIMIPVIVLVLMFIPDQDTQLQAVEKEEKNEAERVPMGSKFMISVVNFTIFSMIYAPLYSMASVYITENALGNEAYAGLVTSVAMVGSALCCAAFGMVYKTLRARTSLISYAIMAAGLIGIFFVRDSTVFLVVNIVVGGSYGLMISYQYANLSVIVAPQNITKAVSYVTALNSLGFFVTTYVTTALMGVTGGGVASVSLIYGIVAVVCLVVELFNTKGMEKREQ